MQRYMNEHKKCTISKEQTIQMNYVIGAKELIKLTYVRRMVRNGNKWMIFEFMLVIVINFDILGIELNVLNEQF